MAYGWWLRPTTIRQERAGVIEAEWCIRVSTIVIIGSDNGLSRGQRQAIIWPNAGILLIGLLGVNFSEILIEIDTFSFKKMHLKMSSAKWCLFRLDLSVLYSGSFHNWWFVSWRIFSTYFNRVRTRKQITLSICTKTVLLIPLSNKTQFYCDEYALEKGWQ